MTVPVRWKKSTRSQNTSNCVELGNVGGVRDSKNPSGPTLAMPTSALIAAVKSGRVG